MSTRRLPHLFALTAVAGALVAPAAAGGATVSPAPTAAQIHAAVKQAEKSSDLWATINVCNVPTVNPRGLRQLGLRVQVPALGFPTRLYMTLGVDYWVAAKKRYASTGAKFGPHSVGIAVHKPRQDGSSFPFKPPATGSYLMRGVATLEWRIGKRVLGRVKLTTRGGFKHVDFGDPHGLSVATCTISG